jgi:hypothetical protein
VNLRAKCQVHGKNHKSGNNIHNMAKTSWHMQATNTNSKWNKKSFDGLRKLVMEPWTKF